MMCRRPGISLVCVLALILMSSGCGTIGNFASLPLSPKEPQAYGGVLFDAKLAGRLYPEDYDKLTQGDLWAGAAIGPHSLYFLLDFPLCAIADTLTLPIALYLSGNSDNAQSNSTPPASASAPAPVANPVPQQPVSLP